MQRVVFARAMLCKETCTLEGVQGSIGLKNSACLASNITPKLSGRIHMCVPH